MPPMNKMKSPIRIAVLSFAVLLCASSVSARGFNVFANAFLDSARTPTTRVTAEVSLSSLVFFKKLDVYNAEYDVYLEIDPKGDGEQTATSFVMHGVATVESYRETRSHDLRSRTWREFQLEPGDYVIRAVLRVKGTRIGMRKEIELHVPDFLSSGIGFGTPRVLMVRTEELRPFTRWADFERSPSAERPDDVSLAMFDHQPAVRFEVFIDGKRNGSAACDVFYEVVAPDQQQVLYGKRRLKITGRDDAWVIGFNVDDWAPGLYKVNIRAVTKSPERNATTSIDVKVDVTRSMLTTGFDDTMEILSYIYSREELDGLRRVPEEERAEEWARFWRFRDPDPTTPENEALEQFILRITYVADHFSHIGEGWRSDRGKIFIRYGKPDQVDRTSDQRQQGEYEVWRYYAGNRTFVFYDMFGVGDYKLVEGELF